LDKPDEETSIDKQFLRFLDFYIITTFWRETLLRETDNSRLEARSLKAGGLKAAGLKAGGRGK
jgi:hypothetical protein